MTSGGVSKSDVRLLAGVVLLLELLLVVGVMAVGSVAASSDGS